LCSIVTALVRTLVQWCVANSCNPLHNFAPLFLFSTSSFLSLYTIHVSIVLQQGICHSKSNHAIISQAPQLGLSSILIEFFFKKSYFSILSGEAKVPNPSHTGEHVHQLLFTRASNGEFFRGNRRFWRYAARRCCNLPWSGTTSRDVVIPETLFQPQEIKISFKQYINIKYQSLPGLPLV